MAAAAGEELVAEEVVAEAAAAALESTSSASDTLGDITDGAYNGKTVFHMGCLVPGRLLVLSTEQQGLYPRLNHKLKLHIMMLKCVPDEQQYMLQQAA